MLKERAFWWGTSFALFPASVGVTAVSYFGMAGINAVSHLTFNHEAPGLVMVLGGTAYGVAVGLLVPCLLSGRPLA